MIEYSFNNFEYVNIAEIIKKEFENWKLKNPNYFSVYKGSHSNLDFTFNNIENEVIPIQKTSIDSINVSILIENSFEAPLLPNTVIGTISANSESGFIINSTIYTTNEIPKKGILDYFNELFFELLLITKKNILEF